MLPDTSTVKSSLRKSIIQTHRARGKGLNNIWLVYSHKSNRDLILPSDRQLIHWLYYLESNPEVTIFKLPWEKIISQDESGIKATIFDAEVVKSNGLSEWHEVKAGTSKCAPEHLSQMQAQINASKNHNIKYVRFNDIQLKPKVKVALRWFKALHYVAAIRNQQLIPCRNSLIILIQKMKSGTLKSVLDRMDNFEESVVIGMVVRLAIENILSLNLHDRTLGYCTQWKLYEQNIYEP